MMSAISKICFLSAVIFSFQTSAKDTVHEKPTDFTDPDNHRFIIRAGSSVLGGVRPPEADENNKSAQVYNVMDRIFFPNFYQYGMAYVQKNSDILNSRLEYRYKDKYRIFRDTLAIRDSSTYLNYSITMTSSSGNILQPLGGPLQPWKENRESIGIAYYHPISKTFSFGASLKSANLSQSYNLSFATIFGIYTSNNVVFGNAEKGNIQTSGYIPGIGMEWKPLRWFEIHYTLEQYILSGKKDSVQSIFVVGRSVNVSVYDLRSGNFTYTGTSQNLDFVFRFSSWFAARWGIVSERFKRKYDSFISSDDYSTSLAYGAASSFLYPKIVSASFHNDYLRFQVEFSKGF
ncbi:MAG TPA: hypothetical protein PK453_16335 [Leptospiraceae bacterium]|nr:hypothetical protein [Leptospiraceae bacterium]HNF15238.1 hypothetical protein [Leptospiraceae bacterium]HNF26866.1 hypothetical protein [Leptospiraceae bacterium]HNH08112.1 hypothetical protein [Leptospiraceae bacterium]HNI99012.1 hypothetical protein [Leptospiraceae bacterium]